MRTATLIALAIFAAACGAGLASVTQPGASKLELRLIAPNEAEGFKVPTWDGKTTLLVEKRAPLTERDVSTVKLSKLPDGSPVVDVMFDQTAALTLEDITTKNVGKRMALLVNGKVVTAAIIKEKITGGVVALQGPDANATKAIYDLIKK